MDRVFWQPTIDGVARVGQDLVTKPPMHIYGIWKNGAEEFIYLLLKDNCFTEFCCFLENLNINQPEVYIYPLPFEPPSHLPPPPTPLG